VKDVVEFRERRACPDGDAPCPRDVGQHNGLTWRIMARENGRPSRVRLKIGGRTVDAWTGAMQTWTPSIMQSGPVAREKLHEEAEAEKHDFGTSTTGLPRASAPGNLALPGGPP
jgi:hypothetical protein